ncbi:MAG: HAD hydrolase-like protein [Alphaproteobacteria bacterium]|nr:HAD hydrolase-like protein [Alphaproteobacteria bacterium]
MTQKLKYLSRIKDEFDSVICGVNGVFMRGEQTDETAVHTLIKLYQSGKKVALASNTGMRVRDLYYDLKQKDVPMNIFYAMITAGEIAHFYLKNTQELGRSYFNLDGGESKAAAGLDYSVADSMVLADFVLAESTNAGINTAEVMPLLEQALHLQLPFLCIGNNTSCVGANGVTESIGAIAEQYAMMGGKVIPIGKPDARIAGYLAEGMQGFWARRCLVVGDDMATDMRMGNTFGAKTLLVGNGVHQLSDNIEKRLNDLSAAYGLNVDYVTETLVW